MRIKFGRLRLSPANSDRKIARIAICPNLGQRSFSGNAIEAEVPPRARTSANSNLSEVLNWQEVATLAKLYAGHGRGLGTACAIMRMHSERMS